jgi:hypothetical protein
MLDIDQTIGAEQDDFPLPDYRNLESRNLALLHLTLQKGLHTVGLGLSLRLGLETAQRRQ